MANMGFGGTTSQPEVLHLEDPMQPLVISFHYHRVKEKEWGENRITAAFQPIGLPGFTPDKPPVSSIQLGAPRTEVSTLEMKLPDGWSIVPPPEVHAHTPFVSCDVTYEVKDGTMIATRKLVVLDKQVPLAKYKEYQSWYDDAGVSGVPYVQLLPKPKPVDKATAEVVRPVDVTSESRPSVRPSDAAAAKYVTLGFESIRNMDLDSARTNFDKARDMNPTEAGLWSGYASISYMLGKPTEAVTNSEQELKTSGAPPVPDAEKLLAKADLSGMFPAGSKAHLLRKAYVNCTGRQCQLVLVPLQ